MGISKYEEGGRDLWMVYVNIRSKENPSIRKQRRIYGIETQKQAFAEEKRLTRILTEELARQASQGLTWEAVINRWEEEMRKDGPHFQYDPMTIKDHVSCLKRWTGSWLSRPASDLTKGDGRDALKLMELEGKSKGFQKHVKNTVNVVYRWGIEERLIPGVHSTPVHGLKVSWDKVEKVPDILTIDEIRTLLVEAKRLDHPWYPVWCMALLTGMRNGELNALLWTDIDFQNKKITVSKSYNTRLKTVKSTKAGYWRTVPVSDELMTLLLELKSSAGNRAEVLPRFWEWKKGEQARVLRKFCVGIGIRSVRFHALRACFATQLLAHDIAPARVMKICGWRDLETMQYYIRLAGIDEKGATQVLKILPSDAAVMGEVVNLFEFRARST